MISAKESGNITINIQLLVPLHSESSVTYIINSRPYTPNYLVSRVLLLDTDILIPLSEIPSFRAPCARVLTRDPESSPNGWNVILCRQRLSVVSFSREGCLVCDFAFLLILSSIDGCVQWRAVFVASWSHKMTTTIMCIRSYSYNYFSNFALNGFFPLHSY